LGDSENFYAAAMNSDILQKNLRTLKLNKISDKKAYEALLSFKNLEHLRLANLDFASDTKSLKKLILVFKSIKTLEVIKCKVNVEFFKL
jgi:hypothetical protein